MVKGKAYLYKKYADNANAPLDFNLFSFVERTVLILS